ncbi:flavin-containing monooxygenase [Phaeovulum sp. W22_SRMD_FR3]|uniref:flavin-containing monooxygenase n=1 Tax=Phaeovulum sp. W22_SRMD_FR3 TaxID=3240274 RepID=UPI003F97EE0C
MAARKIHTLIVGAGQAGIAMSEHLSAVQLPHLVLEKARIAEAWRSHRWDSLVANGPAWHDRFPGLAFPDTDPDAFVAKDKVADYFEAYAAQIKAPVRCGVEVLKVERGPGGRGFRIDTTDGLYEADNVVVATGAFQKPLIPQVIPADAGFLQLHSSQYRNPDQLPDGGVLVVGAGSSGVQIADELNQAGRKVYLAVGPHDRPPRSYRGRDFVWWLGVLGKWDLQTPAAGAEHVTIAVSGAQGGRTIDFRRLAGEGITLVGRSGAYQNGHMAFADDLARNLDRGDANYLSLLREADAYIARHGLDLPPEPEAHVIIADPECVSRPVRDLDLRAAGIGTVIWAVGFERDYSWLEVDAFDAAGKPVHQRGVSKEPGIYFLGLPWQSRRGSSFIWGVWYDARHVADQIVTQGRYTAYDQSARARQAAPESAIHAAAGDPDGPYPHPHL